jgi:hypothetical protein
MVAFNIGKSQFQSFTGSYQVFGYPPAKSMESTNECVTTHLPNELSQKMDVAEAGYLYSTTSVSLYANK